MKAFAPDNTAQPPHPSRTVLRVSGIFLAAVLALGMGITLLPREARTLPRSEAVADGEWTRAFERGVDQHSPLREWGMNTWGVLNYLVFREGRDGVLVGSDGWLYTTEEFEIHGDEVERVRRSVAVIRTVQARLEERGTALVVVVVPAKARVYPQHLARYGLPPQVDVRRKRFLTALEEAGVTVVDPLPEFLAARARAPVFFRTDTHWTPFGANVAATSVAAAVRTSTAGLPHMTFRSVPRGQAVFDGDLMKFLPLGSWRWLGPPSDRLTLYTVESGGDSSSLDDSSGGLLGDVSLPVVLVGTSYSASSRWNFEGWLKQRLGSDVLNAAAEGQGPFRPMRDYLAGPEFQEESPALVIWEIPERFIAMSPEGELAP